MFDLVAEVSAHERQHPPGPEVRATQHLPQIPLRFCLVLQDRRGELLRAVGEVPADDDDVGPPIAKPVRHHGGSQCAAPPPAAQSRKQNIILDGLAEHLADHSSFVGGGLPAWVVSRSCPEYRPCIATPHPNAVASNTARNGCNRLLGRHSWSRVTPMSPKPRSSSTPTTLGNLWCRGLCDDI